MGTMTKPTATAPVRPRAAYNRGAKKGVFDLDVYDVRDLVERTGLIHEIVTLAARKGELPGRKFLGPGGWRFTHAAVMWWLAGSPGRFDPLAWNVQFERQEAEPEAATA